MLTDLCHELHNWFEVEKHYGEFEIAGGALTASFLQPGQYFRIIGSIFNDGVWQYGDTLTDETFDGAIWAMAIPPAVLELNDQIDSWLKQYGETQNSPYSSESFGGYSYSKNSSGGSGADKSTWQGVFAPRLNKWRKM
jgi:hypothetical protein